MPKITNQDIKDLGFTESMYNNKDVDESFDFDAFIDAVISEVSIIFEGRIGTSNYNIATSPVKDYIKRAEKCLVASEMIQRRINIILGQANGAEIDISQEISQKKIYFYEANDWLNKIVTGVTTANGNDIAMGVLTTSHFELST